MEEKEVVKLIRPNKQMLDIIERITKMNRAIVEAFANPHLLVKPKTKKHE